jgi:hypothetical protein
MLSTIALRQVVAPQLTLSQAQQEQLSEDQTMQDIITGILLLKLSEPQLKAAERLPDALEQLGMLHSKMALLYALGAIDSLYSEGFVPKNESAEKIDLFFKTWFDQPAKSQLPAQAQLLDTAEVLFTSIVMGVELRVTLPNNLVSIQVAESFLGSSEAFFATSLNRRIIPYRETALVRVSPNPSDRESFSVTLNDGGTEPVIEILHPATLDRTVEGRKAFMDSLQESIVQLMTHIAYVENPKKYIETVAGEELGFRRALNFSEIDILTGNIFGDKPRFTLADWVQDARLTNFPYRRLAPWHTKLIAEPELNHEPLKFGSGDISPEMRARYENATHRQQRVVSMIDIPLWNKAKWRATLYA